MLSVTYEITDIKSKLENTFSVYGYATDDLFSGALTLSVEDAMYENMLAYLSQGSYDAIKACDRVGLSLQNTYIYRAEICFACYQFLKKKAKTETQSRSAQSESLETDGYKRSVTGDIATNGYLSASDQFYQEGKNNLVSAGIKTSMQLKRGNSSLAPEFPGWPVL